jgi:hypothetical protein
LINCANLLDEQFCHKLVCSTSLITYAVSEKFVLTKFSLCSSRHWHCGYIHNVLWSPQVSEKGWARKRPVHWWPNH